MGRGGAPFASLLLLDDGLFHGQWLVDDAGTDASPDSRPDSPSLEMLLLLSLSLAA